MARRGRPVGPLPWLCRFRFSDSLLLVAARRLSIEGCPETIRDSLYHATVLERRLAVDCPRLARAKECERKDHRRERHQQELDAADGIDGQARRADHEAYHREYEEPEHPAEQFEPLSGLSWKAAVFRTLQLAARIDRRVVHVSAPAEKTSTSIVGLNHSPAALHQEEPSRIGRLCPMSPLATTASP